MKAKAQPPSDPGTSTAWLEQVLQHARPDAVAPPQLPPNLERAWDLVAGFCGWTEWELAQEIARQFGLHCEPLPGDVPAEMAVHLRSPWMRRYLAVPLRRGDEHVVVAVANPTAEGLVERVSFLFGVAVVLTIAPPAQLRAHYDGIGMRGSTPGTAEADPQQPPHEEAPSEFHLEDHPGDSAIITLCNVMLRHAIEQGASDIHVQPLGDGGIVRMRLDGLLHNAGRLPAAVMRRLIGRVKAVSGMNPTDRLHPQDAHARAVAPDRTLDMRISTLPVIGGEKLVIRLLGGHRPLTLADLDLTETELGQLQNLVEASMGLVIVAGPTGSGKTTTLYAVLNEKNTSDVSIVTVEDPVEIRMPRLAQTEVNAKSGLDFANALRSVVRQDPDIVLIGEIRDTETASIAMQAAITGHLVFASLHANDAVSVLPRLHELGVNSDLVGEAVRGVVSQRLVRTLCNACAAPAAAPWTPAEGWLMQHAGLTTSRRAVGCAVCHGTGCRGRRSVMQVLTVTPEVAHLLDRGAPLSELRKHVAGQGMRLLAQSALERIERGQTSVQEVLREMGTEFWRSLAEVAKLPSPGALGLVRTPQDDLQGEVLLIAKDDAWRTTLAGWLRELGWSRIVEASDEQGVLAAMRHHTDFGLTVVDVEKLLSDRARLLMQMRSTLAGAVVPILVLGGLNNVTLASDLALHASTRLADLPSNAKELAQQLRPLLQAYASPGDASADIAMTTASRYATAPAAGR